MSFSYKNHHGVDEFHVFLPIGVNKKLLTFLEAYVGLGERGKEGGSARKRGREVKKGRRRRRRKGEEGKGKERRGKRGPGPQAPAIFFKMRFYPLSGPRRALSLAFLSSSNRALPFGEVSAPGDTGKQRSKSVPQPVQFS